MWTLTPEGEIYYRRCKAILAEVEDAEAALTSREVRGLLRVDVHGPMARAYILPELPAFLERHPALTLFIGEGDRYVDLAARRIRLRHSRRRDCRQRDDRATAWDCARSDLRRPGLSRASRPHRKASTIFAIMR
ncbi:MAG: hypothetical protein WDM89_05885 [Rhizomicrobium sp.]